MPAETTDTKVLPVADQDETAGQPVRYSLDPDRCVIEISLRLLGVRLARARLHAGEGELDLAGRPPVASIRLDVPATPNRVSVPLAARLFGPVARRRRLSFTAPDVDVITAPPRPSAMDGELDVHGADGRPWSLSLTARFPHVDEHAIVLAARGPVRPPARGRARPGRLARLGRWMWIEAAAEFTR